MSDTAAACDLLLPTSVRVAFLLLLVCGYLNSLLAPGLVQVLPL